MSGDKLNLSISQRRTLSEFSDYIKTEDCIKTIEVIRIKCGIPESGFKLQKEDMEFLLTPSDYKIIDIVFYVPKEIIETVTNDSKIKLQKLSKLLLSMFPSKITTTDYLYYLMHYYVLFDQIIPEVSYLVASNSRIDFVNIESLLFALGHYWTERKEGEETPQHRAYDFMNKKSKKYKYALFISEDCSTNEILEFVNKNWKPKKAKLLRKRKKMKRDQIIFKNPDKNHSQISKLVDYEDITDKDYLGKIKRKQKKK